MPGKKHNPERAWRGRSYKKHGERVRDLRDAGAHVCVLGADGCCSACGVSLMNPCPRCAGAGYHNDGCKEIEA